MERPLNMQDDYLERQKRLIEGENVNVTESNVLKEFLKIVVNLVLILAVLYYSVFLISGIAIKCMPIDKQIILENFMTKISIKGYIEDVEVDKTKKIDYIKNKILKYDANFPKTSKLNVKILKLDEPNALCMPNGDIYITSALYEKIKASDDMLFFIIAHEMAHYKNKDHIMNLRKNIASSVVLITVAFAGGKQEDLSTLVGGTMDMSNLNYSRGVEARADKYAGKMLLKEYGNVEGGVKTLELLSEKEYPEILGIFSTHPTIKTRIKKLKKIKL